MKIIKNKKGIFGINTDFLGQIGSFLSGIISVIPTPVKFLIFLLLIVGFSYVLSIMFMGFGTYCNSANQPVKLNVNLLTGGLNLMNEIPSIDELGHTSIKVTPSTITKETCAGNITDGAYKYDGKMYNFTEQRFYEASGCTNCKEVTLYEYFQSENNNSQREATRVGGAFKKYCLPTENVYRLTDTQKTWWQRTSCGITNGCEPPNHYYYSALNGAYMCADDSCSGVTRGKAWDELLANKGATLLYPTATNGELDVSANQAVGITCVELKPRLGVFGIDLFSIELWLFIVLIFILFWGWKTIS